MVGYSNLKKGTKDWNDHSSPAIRQTYNIGRIN